MALIEEELDAEQVRPAGVAPPGVVRLLTALLVLLIVASASLLLWAERRQTLADASALNARRAAALAGDVASSLAVAAAAIDRLDTLVAAVGDGVDAGQELARAQAIIAPMLARLPLPLRVQAVDGQGRAFGEAIGPALPAGPDGLQRLRLPAGPESSMGWSVEATRGAAGERVIPLVRPASAARHGVAAWAVLIDHEALVRRLDRSRVRDGGDAALLRVEADGSMAVLARAPHDEAALGAPAPSAPSSVRAAGSDGASRALTIAVGPGDRLVAFERLPGEAHRLVLSYGVSVQALLAPWHRQLRWTALGSLALALAVAAGGRRLEKALRRQAGQQQLLLRSESRFRALADNLPDVVVRLDREGRHLYANTAVQQATGLPPEAFIGKTNAELGMPADKVATWMAALQRAFAQGRSERLEFTYPGPDGARVWESVVAVEPVTADGAGLAPSTALVISRDITERKRADQALRDSEVRFRKLFEAAPEAISVSERDSGRLLQVNEAYCELFGLMRDQAIGRTSIELGLWAQPQAREQMLARLSAGEPVRGFEGAARRRSGESFDVSFSAELIELDGTHCLLLMFRDISERKRLEAALQASEARLSYLLASAPVVIYTARPDGDFAGTYFSPNTPGLLGWPAERFLNDGAFWVDHLHAEDRPAVLQALNRLAEQDHVLLEYRFEHADGSWRWMRDELRVQRDSSGRPLELVGSWIDISERRAAEDEARRLAGELEQRVRQRTAQLAHSETRYRNIFETVPVALGEEDWSGVQRLLRELRAQGVSDGAGYFATRPDFVQQCLRAVKIERLNRRALELHDVSQPQQPPAGLASFYPRPEDLSQFVGELVALWNDQRLLTAKRSLPSLSGRPLHLMLTMSLPGLDDEDGTALTCLVDITELDHLNAELDRSVARLQQVNQELETFTYTVSHDLKAPLRGIDGYSRLLLADHRAQLDEEGRQFLGHIRQATQHMGELIDDLLAYSRLERRDLTLAPLRLAQMVDGALAGLRAEFGAAGAELEVRIDPALGVQADAHGLTMALRNLADNALKFSRARTPPRIVIEATRSEGGRVQLSVQDNGVGFDMKFHDRIFAIFQRLHRAEDYPGTGVGLAIVRKAADRMGGRVWARSQPGEGATFTLELPEAPAPPAP